MNYTTFEGNGWSTGLLGPVRIILPAAIAIGLLYLLTIVMEVPFTRDYVQLSVAVALLSMILLRSSPAGGVQAASTFETPEWASVGTRWMVLLASLLALGYVTKQSAEYSRRVILVWAIVTPVVLVAASYLLRHIVIKALTRAGNSRTAVFAGYNEVSALFSDRLKSDPTQNIRVCGFFDDRSADRLGAESDEPLLGRLPDLAGYVKQRKVDVIFVALPMRHVQRVMGLLDDLRDTTASIYYVPDIFVYDLIQARTGEIAGMPVVAMCETPFYGFRGIVKRGMDILIGGLALLAFSPLMLVTAVLVKLSSPGPVIFKQRRYGLDGQEIAVYKFRTMRVTEDGGKVVQATKDDPRVTSVGRVLRRLSIDELPQLVNVLQGRMSLVGPRPHAVAHNEQYRQLIKGYMIRHKVKPGITGLAQVNGCRGETTRLEDMEARVKFDLEYLRHWSPYLDLRIMALTALRAFSDAKAY